MPKLSEAYARALVTGAGGGLGEAFTAALIGEGISVWGTSRNPDSLPDRDLFTSVELDLSHDKDFSAWYDKLDSEAGGFDIVINNAGFAAFDVVEEMEAAAIKEQVSVLLTGPMQIAGAAVKAMRTRGKGCLVNVSSVAGEQWVPYLAVYNAAKSGLSAFSQSLMLEEPQTPPWVVDFRPGDYRTEFNQRIQKASVDGKKLEVVWNRLEQLMNRAPDPAKAAEDLLSALRRFRHCTLYSGSFVQTCLAPLSTRLFPHSLKRFILRRYFNLP